MSGAIDTLMPFLAGAAGALAVWGLARLGLRSPPDKRGWHQLGPSAMHWTALVGCGGAVALCLYIRLFVGSARADAETQMMWLNLLIAGFAIGIGVTVLQIRQLLRTAARWRGSQLHWRDEAGHEQVRALDRVAGMHRPLFGRLAIAFEDGAVLRIDPYSNGVHELWNRIVAIDDELNG